MEPNNDISMSEDVTNDLANGIEQDSKEDPTDPLPPPQPVTTEHLSTIQPAAPANTTPTPTPAPRTSSAPPGPPAAVRPEKPVLHGGPTRQYLNQRITPHLLEGMKWVAMNEPEKPLAWLAEFLEKRSKQVEG